MSNKNNEPDENFILGDQREVIPVITDHDGNPNPTVVITDGVLHFNIASDVHQLRIAEHLRKVGIKMNGESLLCG